MASAFPFFIKFLGVPRTFFSKKVLGGVWGSAPTLLPYSIVINTPSPLASVKEYTPSVGVSVSEVPW